MAIEREFAFADGHVGNFWVIGKKQIMPNGNLFVQMYLYESAQHYADGYSAITHKQLEIDPSTMDRDSRAALDSAKSAIANAKSAKEAADSDLSVALQSLDDALNTGAEASMISSHGDWVGNERVSAPVRGAPITIGPDGQAVAPRTVDPAPAPDPAIAQDAQPSPSVSVPS